jgi:hypothetical protein
MLNKLANKGFTEPVQKDDKPKESSIDGDIKGESKYQYISFSEEPESDSEDSRVDESWKTLEELAGTVPTFKQIVMDKYGRCNGSKMTLETSWDKFLLRLAKEYFDEDNVSCQIYTPVVDYEGEGLNVMVSPCLKQIQLQVISPLVSVEESLHCNLVVGAPDDDGEAINNSMMESWPSETLTGKQLVELLRHLKIGWTLPACQFIRRTNSLTKFLARCIMPYVSLLH